MNRTSVIWTITLVFVFSLVSITLAFLWLMGYDKQNYTRELNVKYSVASRVELYFMNNLITHGEYEKQIADVKMPEITNETMKNEIISNSEIIEEIQADLGTAAILLYKNNHYLRLTNGVKMVLLHDVDFQPYRYLIIKVIFGIIFAIVLITYIFTIRKIKPLRKLKREINKFAGGDLNIKNVSRGNDEIGDVANAFYDAVMQIKKLNESRQLFLRNIMHELKTPITKGRIAVEMIENSKNQKRLVGVFEKLEDLINEFASIERVTSGFGLSKVSVYSIDEIIDEAVRLAMVEKENVRTNLEEHYCFSVDFKLFTIAMKNMIDNAIKYSDDKSVEIWVNRYYIAFINSGAPMQKELEYYLEPFSRGENAKNSFGLGFYIVTNILKAHKLELTYEYEDGKNIFKFNNIDNILYAEDIEVEI